MHDKPYLRGLEATAYSQHGYFTTSQARDHGLSSQLLSHYVRGNRFERVRRGLYRLPGFPRPEDDELREKWMAVGREKAVLSHQSALALLDLSDNIPNAVHLLVGRRYRGLRRPGSVVIHTRPDEEEVAKVWREGLALTAPARTLIDVAGEIQPEQLEMAVWQALNRGLLTARTLEEEARLRGRSDGVSAALTALPWSRQPGPATSSGPRGRERIDLPTLDPGGVAGSSRVWLTATARPAFCLHDSISHLMKAERRLDENLR